MSNDFLVDTWNLEGGCGEVVLTVIGEENAEAIRKLMKPSDLNHLGRWASSLQ